MTKIYISVLIVFLISACNRIDVIKYPRIAKNKCSSRYAIKMGERVPYSNDLFHGTASEDQYLSGKPIMFYIGINNSGDTISNATIGHEVSFQDSLSALRCLDKLTEMSRSKEIADSLKGCEHQYE